MCPKMDPNEAWDRFGYVKSFAVQQGVHAFLRQRPRPKTSPSCGGGIRSHCCWTLASNSSPGAGNATPQNFTARVHLILMPLAVSAVDRLLHRLPLLQPPSPSIADARRGGPSRRRTAEYQRRARRGRGRKHPDRVKAKTTRRRPATRLRRPASTLMRAPGRESPSVEWSSTHRP